MAYILPYIYNIHNILNSDNKESNPCTDLDEPRGIQEFGALRISRQSAHEGGKVVSKTHRLPACLRRYSCYLFLLPIPVTGWVICRAILRLEGKSQSSKHIGNKTHELEACSALPQQSASPSTLYITKHNQIIRSKFRNTQGGPTFTYGISKHTTVKVKVKILYANVKNLTELSLFPLTGQTSSHVKF